MALYDLNQVFYATICLYLVNLSNIHVYFHNRICLGFLALSELATCLLLVFAEGALYRAEVWAVVLLVVSLLAIVACVVVILRQPQNK